MAEHDCFLCVKQDINPPATGDLATGQRWYEPDQRYIVFRGYICDMHADDCCKNVTYIKKATAGETAK